MMTQIVTGICEATRSSAALLEGYNNFFFG